MGSLSLRIRLVLSYGLLAVAVVSSVSLLAMLLIQRYLLDTERDALQANARAIARQAVPMLEPVPNVFAVRQLAGTASFLGNARVRVLNTQGQLVADSGALSRDQRIMWMTPVNELQAAWSEGDVAMGIVSDGERIAIVPIAANARVPQNSAARTTMIDRRALAYGYRLGFDENADGSIPGADDAVDARIAQLQVTQPIMGAGEVNLGSVELVGVTSAWRESIPAMQQAFAIAGLASVLLAGLTGLVMSRGLTSPLRALTRAASQMAGGDLTTRAPHANPRARNNEIAQLSTQFNEMAGKLDASFKSLEQERDALRHFVADASHELRTPITALKTYNELLRGGAMDDAATREEFLATSQTQIERLEWITGNLLDLSRLDAGITRLNLSEHTACDVVNAAVAPFRVLASRKGVAITTMAPSPPFVFRADRARLEMALSNLIDNALKHTPVGGNIEVGATVAGGELRMHVRDTGPGIAHEVQPHVFKRFYRGPGAQTQGAGLGLAIVKSVAQAHGGDAHVDSTPGAGSTFVISVPI